MRLTLYTNQLVVSASAVLHNRNNITIWEADSNQKASSHFLINSDRTANPCDLVVQTVGQFCLAAVSVQLIHKERLLEIYCFPSNTQVLYNKCTTSPSVQIVVHVWVYKVFMQLIKSAIKALSSITCFSVWKHSQWTVKLDGIAKFSSLTVFHLISMFNS